MTAHRLALLFLAVASPLLLVTFVVPGPVAEYVFGVLVMAFPVALITLGAARRGRRFGLTIPFVALLVILEGCAIAMLVLRGRVLDGPWVAGLPLAAAIQLYGLWLSPLLLVALAYALTFDRFEMRDEDVERFEQARRTAGEKR